MFATEGAKVVLTDILAAEGAGITDAIVAAGGEARFQKLDGTSEADWDALVSETLSAYGRIDVLVNNAGVSGSPPDIRNTGTWDEQINVNALGVFHGLSGVSS